MTRARPLSAVLRRARNAVFAFGLLATVAGFAWSAPTPARAAGCSAPQVAVLVDLSHWGGSERVGCVSWSSSLTGYQALHAAGFTATGTVHDGPGFVCRIDGYPTAGAPDHEACVQTPSKKTYWSYWHANARGSSWTYSALGVASYHPHAGSVDAWTFGDGSAPPVSPSAVLPTAGSAPVSQHSTPSKAATSTSRARAPSRVEPTRHAVATHTAPGSEGAGAGHAATSKSAAPASTAPSGAANPSGAASPSGADTRSGGARSGGATSGEVGTTSVRAGPAHPSTASSGAGTVPSTAAGRTTAPTPAEGTPAIVANRSALVAGSTKVSGSPWPTISGIVVVAALAAAGGWRAWRRRSPRTHAG